MGIFVAILIGSMTFIIASGSESICCNKKTVGGVVYTLVEVDPEASESPYYCKNHCVYSTVDGGRYCFRVGDLESICNPEEAILFIGGSYDNVTFGDTVDVYPRKPLEPCHFNTNPIPAGNNAAAAAYRGDTILMCGGNTGIKTNKCYYIEKNGSRPEGPNMTVARFAFTMNTVGSNLVAVGGYDGVGSMNSVEILKPDATNWTSAPYTLSPSRGYHCSITISTTSVMLMGGWVGGGLEGEYKLNTTEEMDIMTGEMTAYDDLPVAVSGHACTIYKNEIWVSGGFTDNLINSVYSLDYSKTSNKWMPRANMNYAREGYAMFVVGEFLTVYSGTGPGEYHVERLIGGEWYAKSIESSRRGLSYVPIQCSRI